MLPSVPVTKSTYNFSTSILYVAFFFVFLRVPLQHPLMRRSVVPPTQAELPVPLAPFHHIANVRVLLVLAGALLHT